MSRGVVFKYLIPSARTGEFNNEEFVPIGVQPYVFRMLNFEPRGRRRGGWKEYLRIMFYDGGMIVYEKLPNRPLGSLRFKLIERDQGLLNLGLPELPHDHQLAGSIIISGKQGKLTGF